MTPAREMCSVCGIYYEIGKPHWCKPNSPARAAAVKEMFPTCGHCGGPHKTEGCGFKGVRSEAVDHPAHYGGGDNPYEVIKVMEAWLTRDEFIGAMKFNIHKYLARALKKGREEDYRKAGWYNKYLDGYLTRHPS